MKKKADYEVNFRRIDELMAGTVMPENPAEFAMVKAYSRAASGEPLINIFLDMKDEMSYYDIAEYAMFIFGYATGQHDFLEKINGLDLAKFKKDDDENVH